MLRISRPKLAPAFLSSERVNEQRDHILSFLRRPLSERRERRDGVNEDIFFERPWRFALAEAFNHHCAFCESLINTDGFTLHFRPLRFLRGSDEDQLGYYLWLAFEWRNIFYACGPCLKLKSGHFPVDGVRANYLASYEEVEQQESRLLIDPAVDDPSKHLRYTVDGMVWGKTEMGNETISVFSLNRPELVKARSDAIDKAGLVLGFGSRSSLGDWLNSDIAHFGAVVQVLKRIVKYWQPSVPVTGTGNRFIESLERALTFSDRLELQRLNLAIATERSPSSQPVSVSDDYLALRSPLGFSPVWSFAREISRIQIKRFKALNELVIKLPDRRQTKAGMPALMILGENSTGKSSILSAIALALIGQREAEKLRKYFPAIVQSRDVEIFDQLDRDSVSVAVKFFYDVRYALFSYDPVNQQTSGGDQASTIVLGYGARRHFDAKKKERAAGAAARVRTLFDPLASIPYPGEWLRSQSGKRLDTISAALRIVLALDDADELIVESDRLAVRANGRVTSIEALSEGYRSVFVMTVDIIRELLNHWEHLEEAQAVVLIDEIETHLHPRWKMQVMTSLRRVFPKVQFIVTTHDPLCLRGMDDGEVIVLQRDDHGVIRPLENLPPVSGMSAEQLLTSDYFGLASTTDPTTEIALASIAGDVARRSVSDGALEVSLAASTKELISRLTIGKAPSEEIIQNALMRYLEMREADDRSSRPKLRKEAIEAVLKALSDEAN